MSLVYNNKKFIGKCSKFAIEKVQGTSPFVMLENFELKQPHLNENQQKTCNLCNEEQKQATVYDSRGRSVAIDGGSLVFVENYREYAGGMLQTQQSSLPINFCPMCGKRLAQEAE
ncbi:hypothetical protein HAX42_13915 [Enterococcus casseliflavus]|nr:hypothetical protein [Enterococcus casseliflavus]